MANRRGLELRFRRTVSVANRACAVFSVEFSVLRDTVWMLSVSTRTNVPSDGQTDGEPLTSTIRSGYFAAVVNHREEEQPNEQNETKREDRGRLSVSCSSSSSWFGWLRSRTVSTTATRTATTIARILVKRPTGHIYTQNNTDSGR